MVFGYQGTCREKRRMLPSLVGEKNRMEAQTQAPDHLCSAAQTDRQTQTTPPPDHMFLLKDWSVTMVWYLLTDTPKIAI